MLDYYRSQRADGGDVSAEGGMLFCQWDVLDSEEHGRCLEWNLTRQFILEETSDEGSHDAGDGTEPPGGKIRFFQHGMPQSTLFGDQKHECMGRSSL